MYAHTISDDIHQQQRALRGVARTKLTFNSDRSGERMSGTVENRTVKEVYISDYDGESQRQVTTNRSLNINSVWSSDGRSIAYTSYRRGPPNIFIANIYEGTSLELTKGEQSWTPAWSPDGTRIAFSSTRDGNPEIYVANRDGSNVRRLTNHPANDITPTWSPTGTQIAFTSNRRGEPQIWVMSATDGLGLTQLTSESYADRPTWSPGPFNEIAYAARTGPGQDIRVIDVATRQVRQLTFGEGTNESPAFAPNGRHLAFSSTRSGKTQIFTHRARRQGSATGHADREQLSAGLVEVRVDSSRLTVDSRGWSTSARVFGKTLTVDSRVGRSRETLGWSVMVLLLSAACHKNPAARDAPDPAATGRRLNGADDAPSTPAGRRTDHRSARAGPGRCDQVGVTGRLEQELAAQARLLRVRQQRAVAGRRGGAQ